MPTIKPLYPKKHSDKPQDIPRDHFMAFGTALATVKYIRGVLVSKSTGILYPGVAFRTPNQMWGVLFQDYPAGAYTLQLVWGPDGDRIEIGDLQTESGTGSSSTLLLGSITIFQPYSGQQYTTSSFLATGTTTETGTGLVGTIENGAGTYQQQGITVTQPGNMGMWAVSFSNVPNGSYTLEITINSASATQNFSVSA